MGAALGSRNTSELLWLGTTVLGWLDMDTCPRLIIDERFEIRWCNRAAEQLLSELLGIEARGNVVTTSDGSSLTKLKALLQAAHHGPASTCIGRIDNEGWLVLRCVGVRCGAGQLFCLSINRAGDGSVWTFDHLAEAFDLTRTEHRVLQDLLSGNEAETLSARHGVSIETTRTHIKSIYAKVGVNTREALFARLQGFRA